LAGEFPAIAFLADQVDGAHAFSKANGERNIRLPKRQRDATDGSGSISSVGDASQVDYFRVPSPAHNLATSQNRTSGPQ